MYFPPQTFKPGRGPARNWPKTVKSHQRWWLSPTIRR